MTKFNSMFHKVFSFLGLNKLGFITRYLVLSSIPLILVFFIVGKVTISSQKRKFDYIIDKATFQSLEDIENILKNEEFKEKHSDLLFGRLYYSFENGRFNLKTANENLASDLLNTIKEADNSVTEYFIKESTRKKRLISQGFVFLLSSSGEVITHPYDEGKDYSDKLFFSIVQHSLNKKGKFKSIWPESFIGKSQYFYFIKMPEINRTLIAMSDVKKHNDLFKKQIYIFSALLLALYIIISGIVYFMLRKISQSISFNITNIESITNPEKKFISKENVNQNDVMGKLFHVVEDTNQYIDNLTQKAHLLETDDDIDLASDSRNDKLSISLLNLQKSIANFKKESEERHKESEEKNWIAQGIAKFSDILRKNNDLKTVGEMLVSNLAEYLQVNQCALFVSDEQNNDEYTLVAAYAYNRSRHLKSKIKSGEGLIGTCIKEKKKIQLSDIPEDYLKITSGLGESVPRELVIMPLLYENNVLGVIEIASFEKLGGIEKEFLEQLSETIAGTIANVRTNENTNRLLIEMKEQAEQMATQEEEMKQTMEELKATHEEMERRNKQYDSQISKLEKNKEELKNQIAKLQDTIEFLKRENVELKRKGE